MAVLGRPLIIFVAVIGCLVLFLTSRGGVRLQHKSSVPVSKEVRLQPTRVVRHSLHRAVPAAPKVTKRSLNNNSVPTEACPSGEVVYPAWPEGFNVSVNAVFIIGEQKSGSTWLWEMLNAHPCLLTSAQPYFRMGAITTKETYYMTSTKIGKDAREFLVPWLGYSDRNFALSEDAWKQIGDDWFARALRVADRGTASSSQELYRGRTYTSPPRKLEMSPCKQHFLLEATPHNLHTPIAAARIQKLFPKAIALASLKEPVWRMRSAYNQFVGTFKRECSIARPANWCPVFKYYQLQAPTYAEVIQNELEYMKARGCAFKDGSTQTKSWMDCFGCAVMDPWRDKVDNQHIWYPPYAPSAALGIYAEMIKAWLLYFPAEQMMAINYEDMVSDPFAIVNRALRMIGVEEYTREQWAILTPTRLGFKGSGAHSTDDATQAAEAKMADFFKPHNERLAQLMAEYDWPWTPFKVDYGAANVL